MVRKTSDAAVHSGSWQWSRTATTQRKLLDAAAAVFSELGFTDAGISDIVTRAGSSVGSLYHHFGGKTELFLALWDDYQNEHERLVAGAVAKARKSGENDPLAPFDVGSAKRSEPVILMPVCGSFHPAHAASSQRSDVSTSCL